MLLGILLGVAADQNRRLELGKAFLDQKIPEGVDYGRLHGEDVARALKPKRQRQVVEMRVDVELCILIKRQRLRL